MRQVMAMHKKEYAKETIARIHAQMPNLKNSWIKKSIGPINIAHNDRQLLH